jgi:hypothetical protein
MEGRQKTTTGARNVTKGIRETHGNRQESPNGNRVTTEMDRKWWPTVGTRVVAGGKWRTPAYTSRPPHHVLIVISERADPSLVTQGRVGEKPYLVTRARPDIAAGWPERQPDQLYTLKTVSAEALPILK